jgi:hypothetical protein
MDIVREDNKLVLKSATTPQGGLSLHAESETSFFTTVADLQLTFSVNGSGKAPSLVLHFAGSDYPAIRIEPESPTR